MTIPRGRITGIMGPSGTGKSALLDALVALMPPEQVVSFARLTPQSLFYAGSDALVSLLSGALLLLVGLARASILAQPEPLKTMAGVDIALRIAPPHTVHTVGPDSCTPCVTSVRVPHAVQT